MSATQQNLQFLLLNYIQQKFKLDNLQFQILSSFLLFVINYDYSSFNKIRDFEFKMIKISNYYNIIILIFITVVIIKLYIFYYKKKV